MAGAPGKDVQAREGVEDPLNLARAEVQRPAAQRGVVPVHLSTGQGEIRDILMRCPTKCRRVWGCRGNARWGST